MNYGFSDTISETDKRQKKWKKQRRKRGFDDTELWDLYTTFFKFMAPRLRRFKKINKGYPPKLTPKKWKNIIGKIADGFQEYIDKDDLGDMKKVNKALRLFHKWFFALWS
jgi:hypothetical protein